MLRLEAPPDLLQITNGTPNPEQAVEIANPAVWVRTLVNQQRQAENDLRRLTELCGDAYDRTDRRTREIEQAYQTLAEGTRYVYDRVNANEKIAEEWIRSKLSNAANAYQSLASNIWQAILEHTNEANERQICQATQLARVNDALSFLAEANAARNQHLANFQGNVELWAAAHQNRVSSLENQLREARAEIQRIATRIPLPATPPAPPNLPTWRSPARQTSTSAPAAYSPAALGSPLRLNPGPPTRRQRPPALPMTLEMRQRLVELRRHISPRPLAPQPAVGQGGNPPSTPPGSSVGPPSGPPSEPPCPPLRPHHSPSPPRNPAPTITTQDLVRLVAQGIERARQAERPTGGARVHISRLKMENPEKFDGKCPTAFNQWWESVTMYLGFYPDTTDPQKITWVRTLLTDTALVWHLHRYRELRENDTWANYSAAIRAEYHNEREAADAQLKLGQLRYQGSIRAYLTEFRALNNFARATGEALREKVDLAMPDAILDMRFAHYLEDFADDEGFLQATHLAGLQVEKKKALKQAREQTRGTGASGTSGRNDDRKKQEGNRGETTPNKADTSKPRQAQTGTPAERPTWWGAKDHWASKEEASKGVPQKKQEAYFKNRDDCWRCGRTGHRTFEHFSFSTLQGTPLPKPPWKAATVAVWNGKRRREEAEEELLRLNTKK